MDPNANIAEQLMLARKILWDMDSSREADERAGTRLAELVVALDEWLKRGGVLPSRWTPATKGA